MAETEAAERPFAETPAPSRDAKKSVWKIALTPIVLALLGAVLLPIALLLNPSPPQTSAPAYSRLSVGSKTMRITFITYGVAQVNPAVAQIQFEVVGVLNARGAVPSATLIMDPPLGTTFRACPPHQCTAFTGFITSYSRSVELAFHQVSQRFSTLPTFAAVATFSVNAKSFGLSANGLSALVALPEVIYLGTGSPQLIVGYHLPAAASYDWSALPPAALKGSSAGWTEPLTSIDTPSKIAVGLNEQRQSSDNHLAFLAGALIGVAGGALIGAIQELLGNLVKSRD